MAKLRIPTLQHLARNWNPDPDWICKSLVRLVTRPPNFSYELMFRLTRDMLVLRQPYQEVENAVRRIKRPDLVEKFLELLPLVSAHFESENPDYFQDIDPRLYPVGRGLMVPFAPPFLYGSGGQITFPWISFWRSNPLADERLALFVTLVDEILLQDPDLETARFQIIDLSALRPGEERLIRVINASDIPRLSPERVREMLVIFAEGYFRAQAMLGAMPKDANADAEAPHPDQTNFFSLLPPNTGEPD